MICENVYAYTAIKVFALIGAMSVLVTVAVLILALIAERLKSSV